MQWALFEHHVLFIIYTIEVIPAEHGDIIYGGLDWRPRLNMAINLAKRHNLPPPLQKRLRAIRAEVTDKKLAERRNTAVHGVHKSGKIDGEYTLTMPRLPEPNKHTVLTAYDLKDLGDEINALSNKTLELMTDIGNWRMSDHGSKNRLHSIPIREPEGGVGIAKSFYARTKHLFGNFWG